MKCAEARELLSALIDGALSAGEEARVRDHLEGCGTCRERLAGLTEVVELVREIPEPRVGDGFEAAVLDRLSRPRRVRPLRWLAPLAAAACLLLFAGLHLANRSRPVPLEVATERPAPARSVEPGFLESGGSRPEEAREFKDGEDLARDGVGKRSDAEEPVAVSEEALAIGGPAAAPPGKTDRSPPGIRKPADVPHPGFRRYAVRGVEPDSAAGVILAELSSRRARDADGYGPGPDEAQVVQTGSGEVAGVRLHLTPDEIDFVTCLLEERPGVRVDRENGSGRSKKGKVEPSAPAAPGAESSPAEPRSSQEEKPGADDAKPDRLRVEFRFR
jgi:hypothetical protein